MREKAGALGCELTENRVAGYVCFVPRLARTNHIFKGTEIKAVWWWQDGRQKCVGLLNLGNGRSVLRAGRNGKGDGADGSSRCICVARCCGCSCRGCSLPEERAVGAAQLLLLGISHAKVVQAQHTRAPGVHDVPVAWLTIGEQCRDRRRQR